MKRTLIRLLTIICLLAAGSLNSVAQEKKPRPDESKPQKPEQLEFKAPTDGTFKVVLGAKLAFGKVVKGAPYSATATTETVQTLSDGNQIIRKNESKLYRDSEGRTRIEQTLETIGKWTADGDAHRHIFINDPVAGVSYSLDPRTHTANKTLYPKKKTVMEARSGAFMINGQTVTQAEFEAVREKKQRVQEELLATRGMEEANGPELKRKLEALRTGRADADPWKKESLGAQTIEGVTVEGTRSTLTIPAGEIGNTLPIEIVDETWYSPELQTTVMTRHRDPRSGEMTYRLTNLGRGEPDRLLFEIPADYTVSDNKMPAKMMKLPKEEQ